MQYTSLYRKNNTAKIKIINFPLHIKKGCVIKDD